MKEKITNRLTSPNIKIKVTEIRIAPQAETRESRKIGSAYTSQRQGGIKLRSPIRTEWQTSERATNQLTRLEFIWKYTKHGDSE